MYNKVNVFKINDLFYNIRQLRKIDNAAPI